MSTKERGLEVSVGVPFASLQTGVDVLVKLKDEGRYQVFLPRPHLVKFIGEVDEFHVAFSKVLSNEGIQREFGERVLKEIQVVLQCALCTDDLNVAMQILEDFPFESDFKLADGDAKTKVTDLREIVKAKLNLVVTKLITPSLRERSKRLTREINPSLESVDIDLVSERDGGSAEDAIKTPFLRISIRYGEGNPGQLGFPPPWITDVFAGPTKSLNLNADESDIDYLIKRLSAAKKLLARGIYEKVALASAGQK